MSKSKKIPLKEAILIAMDGRKQNWLHEKTGIHQSEISKIINRGMPPSEKQLEKINKALGTEFTND